jgi:DNA-binding response OmpR family regulator
VVLIDVLLPGIDGFDVCRRLRQDSDVPIVMVTARDESQDVIAGLEAGADDYLAKPVNAKVLAARIRALLRRAKAFAGPGSRRVRLAFGQVEVLPEDGVVRVAGDEVHLTKTEFRLLVELASTPGRVFSREQLLETVWGYDYFGDGRIVDVHVRRLRVKIEPDPAAPRHVLTVRGRGYKLAGS